MHWEGGLVPVEEQVAHETGRSVEQVEGEVERGERRVRKEEQVVGQAEHEMVRTMGRVVGAVRPSA